MNPSSSPLLSASWIPYIARTALRAVEYERRRRRRGRDKRHAHAHALPMFEAMEPRLLMSGNGLDLAPPQAPDGAAHAPTLEIEIDRSGVHGHDRLTLRRDGDNLQLVDRRGRLLVNESIANVESLEIIGRDHRPDQLTIDFAYGGSFSLPGGLEYDAGDGRGCDKVSFIGSSGGSEVQIEDDELTANGLTAELDDVEKLYVQTGREDDAVATNGEIDFRWLHVYDAGGDDVYQLGHTDGLVNIHDRHGFDTIDFSNSETGVDFRLGHGRQSFGPGGDVRLTGQFELVIGSPFDDRLIGDHHNNIMVGGDGEDLLKGRGGDDILIGGDDNDTLRGNRGADILIGGTTAFDEDADALEELMEKWTDSHDFDERVENVRFPDEVDDGVFLAAGLTVFADDGDNVVRGGRGMDFAPLGEHDGELKGIEFDSAPIVPDFAGATFEESTNIDNEYFPLIVGSHRVFEVVDEEEGDESDEDAEVVEENGDDDNVIDGEGFILDVLDETIEILGIESRIIRDRAFEDGLLVEDTFDYYAQDDDGNVWYMGEDVTNYIYDEEGNLIGTNSESAWLAGVNGAVPGIIMHAEPEVDAFYYQEFAPHDDALDQGINIQDDAEFEGPLGEFDEVLVVRELNPTEPEAVGLKYYAPGIGMVMEREGEIIDGEDVFDTVVDMTELTVPLKEAKLNIEHNATDEDTGFQGFLDGEGWQMLEFTNADEDVILTFEAKGSLSDLGLTELFFETVEPENAEVSIEEMLAKLGAGNYTIEGPVIEAGEGVGETVGTALLTHAIPNGPELQSPGEGDEVDPALDIVFSWDAVTETIDGDPANIIAYQLIIERVDQPHANMIGKIGFSAYVQSDVTSITLPAGFLEPGTEYEWEVLAIEESGNQTLSSSEFSTTGEGPDVEEPVEPEDPPNLKAARLIIEHNATDEDTGFQGFLDSEGWQQIDILNPDDETVLSFEAHNELGELGMTELFFETVEPENADVPIVDMLALLPAGDYSFEGTSMQNGEDGGPTSGTALLTHNIPAGPELTGPEEDAVVSTKGLVMSWNPVTETIDGDPVNIIAYQLIVQVDESPDPNMIGKIGLSVYVPSTVTSVEVPEELLMPGTTYEWEVLAIEESGNQTLSSSSFETEGGEDD